MWTAAQVEAGQASEDLEHIPEFIGIVTEQQHWHSTTAEFYPLKSIDVFFVTRYMKNGNKMDLIWSKFLAKVVDQIGMVFRRDGDPQRFMFCGCLSGSAVLTNQCQHHWVVDDAPTCWVPCSKFASHGGRGGLARFIVQPAAWQSPTKWRLQGKTADIVKIVAKAIGVEVPLTTHACHNGWSKVNKTSLQDICKIENISFQKKWFHPNRQL